MKIGEILFVVTILKHSPFDSFIHHLNCFFVDFYQNLNTIYLEKFRYRYLISVHKNVIKVAVTLFMYSFRRQVGYQPTCDENNYSNIMCVQ